MGARTEVHTVDQPWPVVYDAFVQALPAAGFDVTSVDAARGRIDFERRNRRFTLAVGAIDTITSEWIATSEQKFGVLPDRHERQFAAIRDALDRYLGTYYS
ncbi:MAG: hypothetical protein U5K30_12620 [Acidimicrobiales bacterium]|nr:hypothetical protein [Acidimicrobiales bacterium]